MALDDGLENLELNIVRGSGVGYSTILEEQVLPILTFMGKKSHVTPIINNQVRYVPLTIILCMYQGIQDAVPVLLKTLTLLGKYSSRFIMRNDIHSVLLGRENVARAPAEFTAEVLESLNQHFCMNGHMKRYGDTGATSHLNICKC